MISAYECFKFVAAQRKRGPRKPPPVLTRDEERSLKKLEASVTAILYEHFGGAPVRFEFNERVLPQVAHALRYEAEEKGWRVTASLTPEKLSMMLVPEILELSDGDLEEDDPAGQLPLMGNQAVMVPHEGPRLLVILPTRGRPAQVLSVIAEYRAKAGMPITIEVIIDDDDPTMMASNVLQRLSALGCVVTVGRHKSKIDACNGGKIRDWEVLLLASDDMMPIADGYAVRVMEAMEEHFPHLDGAIYFDDGYQGENLCTLPIFGRRLYDQFGYVYEPSYTSLFSDTEQTCVLRALGRLQYIDEKIIEHRHHVWGRSPKDALYQKNDAFWEKDKAVYESREAIRRPHAQIGFDTPPLWLSVCIATLPDRRPQLDRLLDHLYTQILRRKERVGADDGYVQCLREVEILVDSREDITVGQKRQALLERTRGLYVAFIDDDDWVSHDYIDRVVGALRNNPGTDCASLKGVMTTAGAVPETFEHSIKHMEWRSEDGAHYRSPNHLNAVRRDLALKVGFPSLSHAEDFDYSKRLRPLLQREASTGDADLYHYWYWPGKTAVTSKENG